MKRSYHRSYN